MFYFVISKNKMTNNIIIRTNFMFTLFQVENMELFSFYSFLYL